MKGCLKIIVALFSILVVTPMFGQESYPDCTNPKIISIPLSDEYNDNVQDEIYYQPADKYTYWYRINVTANVEISYKLDLINDEDLYDLIIYNYKGDNFCNDVVLKKGSPIINKTEGTLSLKEGEVYYFGVLHLRGKGCGHILFLDSEDKNATIKAIQNECFEEALITTIEEEIIEEVPNNQLKGIVINDKTKNNLEAVVNIIDNNGEVKQQLNSTISSGFVLPNFKEDQLIVTVKKFGYKKFFDTVDVIDNIVIIALKPLEVGEKLVMRRIYFHPNTYALKVEAEQELKKLQQFMLENDTYVYQIQGHTNGNRSVKKTNKYLDRGEEWNFSGSAKKLSKLRAEKIKDYLVEGGVKASQLQTIGHGGNKMIVNKPKNMKQASKNIRVEVIVIQ